MVLLNLDLTPEIFRHEKGRRGKIANFPSLCAIWETWENSHTQRPSEGVRYSPDSKRNGANFNKEQLTLLFLQAMSWETGSKLN